MYVLEVVIVPKIRSLNRAVTRVLGAPGQEVKLGPPTSEGLQKAIPSYNVKSNGIII